MKYPSKRYLPSIVSLNTLDVIARRGSVTNAAHELGLTQGAVSRQMLDLEGFLGTSLFERSGKGLSLNGDAMQYLNQVRPMLDQMEAATIAAASRRQGVSTLRVSLPSTFGLLWVFPKLEGFAKAHPEIQLNIANHAGPLNLREASVDVAVVFAEEGFPEGEATLLHAVQRLPIAAPSLIKDSLPLAGEVIARLPLLHQTTVPSAWAHYLSQWGIQLPIPLAGVNYGLVTFALKAAEAGLGAALLPDYACTESLQAGKVVQLNKPSEQTRRGYYLVVLKERQQTPAMEAFCEWLTRR